MPITREQATEFATRYGCCPRTIYRLHRRGIDVADPMDVGLFVLGNPQATPRMIETVRNLLASPPTPGGFEAGWKESHTPKEQ